LKVSRNILPCQHRAGLRHRGGENPAVGIGGRLRLNRLFMITRPSSHPDNGQASHLNLAIVGDVAGI